MKKISLIAISVLFGFGCASKSPEPANPEPISQPVGEALNTPKDNEAVVLKLKPEQAQQMNIETFAVSSTDGRYPILVNGTAIPDRYGIADVSAPIGGRVVRIFAHEGEWVRKGEAVAELESLEFSTLAADLLQAKSEATFEQAQMDRTKQLVEQGATPRIELEQAMAKVQRAATMVRAAETKLKSLGISDAYLRQWASGKISAPTLTITAPISGKVNEHLINVGQAVDQYTKMMDIVSTNAVMVQAYLDPSQAQHIFEGMEAIVRMPETQEATTMRVVAVNASMNTDQKAVSVILSGQTSRGFPKIGQQVQVEMALGSERSGASVLRVPLSSIEYEGDAAFVFVQRSATEYEQRRVTVSRILQDEAILANGLTGGERIATNHIFELKALNRASDYAE